MRKLIPKSFIEHATKQAITYSMKLISLFLLSLFAFNVWANGDKNDSDYLKKMYDCTLAKGIAKKYYKLNTKDNGEQIITQLPSKDTPSCKPQDSSKKQDCITSQLFEECRKEHIGNSDCEEAEKEQKEAGNKFTENCNEFSWGRSCSLALEDCVMCPDNEDYDGHNCQETHKKTNCPQLMGNQLKKAKEDREKASDKMKESKEIIEDLQAKILEKQAKSNDLKAGFQEKKQNIETERERIKEELHQNLKETNQKIDENQQNAIAKLDKEIASSLKTRHEVSNLISDAHTKLRRQKNEVYQSCRSFASQELASYRQKRRKAIADGRFKKSGIKSLMQKNRVSFARKDDARFKHYYYMCLKTAKTQIKEIEAEHKETLKRIRQSKDEYLNRINHLKSTVDGVSKSSAIEKNKNLNNYYKNLQKTLTKFYKQEQGETITYQRQEAQISKEIHHFQNQLMQQTGTLRETQKKLGFNRELEAHLESKGVDEDASYSQKMELLGKAQSSEANYEEKFKTMLAQCKCIGTKETEVKGRNEVICNLYSTEVKKSGIIEYKLREEYGEGKNIADVVIRKGRNLGGGKR